jgi:hypothetical protein
VASTVKDSDEEGFYLGDPALGSRLATEDGTLPTLIGGGVLAVALLLVGVALFTGSRIAENGTTAGPTTTLDDRSASDDSPGTVGGTSGSDEAPGTSTVAAMLTAGGGTPSPTRRLSPLLAAAQRVKVEAVTSGSDGSTLAGPISWFLPTMPASERPPVIGAPTTTTPPSSSPTTAPATTQPNTRPPLTSSPTTSPPTTAPPTTEPPTTSPPTTEPPPPTTEPPTTAPPTTEPPPPTTEPPTTSPPTTTETTNPPDTTVPDTTTPDTTAPDGGLLGETVCTVLDVLGGC